MRRCSAPLNTNLSPPPEADASDALCTALAGLWQIGWR